MKRYSILLSAFCTLHSANAGELANRWVYLGDSLLAKDCVERVSNVVATAHAGGMNGNQVSTCLSEPSLYGYLEDSARRTEEVLHPKKWHISMDEFRNGGTCAACRARGMTMGQIYADAVTKAFNIIQKVHPGAEVYIWGDMLDPNHNGVKEYYNCATSFEGAWKCVPRELIVCCWYGNKCETSMKFFSERGFRTFAAAYYDEKPPFPRSRRWLDAVRSTHGAVGIMYTTWRNAFDDLPAFCTMLKEEWR